MRGTRTTVVAILAALCVASAPAGRSVRADEEVKPEQVKNAISKAQNWLKSRQDTDGSFKSGIPGHSVGVASLSMLALLNSGVDKDEAVIKKGLRYLRSVKLPSQTYDISLMLMTFAAGGNGSDKLRMRDLVDLLESGQLKGGVFKGGWNYSCGPGGIGPGRADRSNSQFAVLALRDAAYAGLKVKRSTWQRVKLYWESGQNAGGWSYVGVGDGPSGSMTVAGIASLVIVERMLDDEKNVDANGKPICCRNKKSYEKLDRAIAWLGRNLRSVARNPITGTNNLYFMYGLERAGRLSGRRFFGKHDWYREGAGYLVHHQNRTGSWTADGYGDRDPTVATSMALLFLSKGLAPVLINKLKYGPGKPGNILEVAGDNWDLHHNDVRNLTEYITTQKKWPKHLTWQTVNMRKMFLPGTTERERLNALEQAKVLYISGRDAPSELVNHPQQYQLLKKYIDRGGFIFAVGNCDPQSGFNKIARFKELVRKIFRTKDGKPDPAVKLIRLPKDHPVYRSEHALRDSYKDLPLYGVNYGCRTPIIFAPVYEDYDWACLWDRWRLSPGKERPAALARMVDRAMHLGENVIAYATGREPPQKLQQRDADSRKGVADNVERGLLQVAKVIHSGDWDLAPRALRNLLIGLNIKMGTPGKPVASTKRKVLAAANRNIFRYPVLYMHGRTGFDVSQAGRKQLKKYLAERGGLLFADACCGSKDFDKSFRELLKSKELFPDKRLERIPATDELFHLNPGFNLKTVRRRVPEAANEEARLRPVEIEGEPFLEGIKVDGRWAVIYSKYDISCALERQASISCSGYVEEDALRIGINVLTYALLQDVRYYEYVKKDPSSKESAAHGMQ